MPSAVHASSAGKTPRMAALGYAFNELAQQQGMLKTGTGSTGSKQLRRGPSDPTEPTPPISKMDTELQQAINKPIAETVPDDDADKETNDLRSMMRDMMSQMSQGYGNLN